MSNVGFPDRQRVPAATAGMGCPRCEARLERIERGTLALDVCRNCGGVWFDRAELEQLHRRHSRALSLLDRALRPKGDARPAMGDATACPRCAQALVVFSFPHAPGVVLDGCRGCGGVWVDRGELSLLEAAARAGRCAPEPAGLFPCPHCGAPVLPGDAGCLDCGRALTAGGAGAQSAADVPQGGVPPQIRAHAERIARRERWTPTIYGGGALVALFAVLFGPFCIWRDLHALSTNSPVDVGLWLSMFSRYSTYSVPALPLSTAWWCDLCVSVFITLVAIWVLVLYWRQDFWVYPAEDTIGSRL